jgi:hypothetical protein
MLRSNSAQSEFSLASALLPFFSHWLEFPPTTVDGEQPVKEPGDKVKVAFLRISGGVALSLEPLVGGKFEAEGKPGLLRLTYPSITATFAQALVLPRLRLKAIQASTSKLAVVIGQGAPGRRAGWLPAH